MKEEHFSSALWVFKEHVELAKQEEKRDLLRQQRMRY